MSRTTLRNAPDTSGSSTDSTFRSQGILFRIDLSYLLSMHEIGQLLDEDMTEDEKVELAEAEEICRKFLAWDLETETEGVKARLAVTLGRAEEPDE